MSEKQKVKGGVRHHRHHLHPWPPPTPAKKALEGNGPNHPLVAADCEDKERQRRQVDREGDRLNDEQHKDVDPRGGKARL